MSKTYLKSDHFNGGGSSGLGSSIPSAIALAVEYAPEHHRAFRVSILFIGYTLGAALGGILSAALIVKFGWPSAFLLGGSGSLALALVLYLFLPESARFLALLGGKETEIAAIMRRLRPDLSSDHFTRFIIADHKTVYYCRPQDGRWNPDEVSVHGGACAPDLPPLDRVRYQSHGPLFPD